MRWLKNKLFQIKLHAEITKQQKEVLVDSINSGKYIGFLFDESQFDTKTELEKFIYTWTQKGKKIETFSFLNVKELPEEKINDPLFSKKDVSWYNAPHGEKVSEFLRKKFDVLITLNPHKQKHIHFLNAASNAKFKIGILPDVVDYYDLILDCQEPFNHKKIFSDLQSTLNKLA